MICPRCGVHNQAGASTCSRCGGPLVSAARHDKALPPVLPVTRRAELARAAKEPRFTPPPPPRSAGPAPAALPAEARRSQPYQQNQPNQVAGELYLMASERPTGQPAPPEGQSGPSEANRPERAGRMAIGLSGA